MKSTTVLILFSWMILATVKAVVALECYICGGCNIPFNPKAEGVVKAPCSGSCHETIADGIVNRRCNKEKMESKCSRDESGVTHCYCNEDLCNGKRSTGATLHVNLATGITVMAVVLRKLI